MSAHLPAAIVFDFDHTLAHLGDFMRWDDARLELLTFYRAYGLPETFLEAHTGALRLFRDVGFSGLLPELDLRKAQRQASQILETFEAEAIPQTFVLPSVIELTRGLSELGVRAGIVTSNAAPVVLAILDRDGVLAAFETIVGRDDVQHLKPSPEGILLCCARLGVTPERCITVGDMTSDIEAARAAGMPGFAVRGGMHSDEELLKAGAEAVFNDVSELLGVF